MSADVQPIKPGRLLSLDAFRGMTIAGMLLVNNAGDWGHIFAPLEHAEWHGCTATDLIFPFFLFIMGVAMTFSFGRRLEESAARQALFPQVVRRTLILFALGLILNFEAWQATRGLSWGSQHLRWLGVLQRIALCYLFASLILLWFSPRAQVLWTAGILVIYYALMKLVSVPGYGPGVLEQAGNLAGYIDTHLMGKHCYEFLKDKNLYFDPEGILSTLPAIGTTLTGVLTGHWLRDKSRDGNEKVAGLCAAGTLLFIVAALWKFDFPLNKKLWTSSYVLHTTAFALFTLGTCYWIIDVKGIKAWSKPFVVYGTNAIAAYFGVGVMAYGTILIRWKDAAGQTIFLKTWIYNHLYKSWIPGLFGPWGDYVSSAAYGTSYVVLWVGILWILYRKRIFIKV